MAQTPEDRVSAGLALIDPARKEGRAGGSTRQAAEAFVFLIDELGFHVSEVNDYSCRNEEGLQFANGDVVVGISRSDVDPVQIVFRGLRDQVTNLRELVPLSVRDACDASCEDHEFSQLARIVKQWAWQQLQTAISGRSE